MAITEFHQAEGFPEHHGQEPSPEDIAEAPKHLSLVPPLTETEEGTPRGPGETGGEMADPTQVLPVAGRALHGVGISHPDASPAYDGRYYGETHDGRVLPRVPEGKPKPPLFSYDTPPVDDTWAINALRDQARSKPLPHIPRPPQRRLR